MIEKPKIIIVDYGVGNLYSLAGALKHFGIDPTITEEASVIESADGVILPGVGSFEAGVKGLELRNLREVIKRVADSKKPILGICLGAQLLLSEGHEFGIFKGLDIIKGKVVKFPHLKNSEKVPHIGWNNLQENSEWSGTIFDSIKQNDQVYFVHSYIMEPELEKNILANTNYGGHNFCSTVKEGSVYGCQFHPEKSGSVGLSIIENFIKLVKTA